MKGVRKIFIIIVIILVVFVLGRNIIIKSLIEIGAKVATGLSLDIGKFNLGLGNSLIHMEDIRLHNPQYFSDPFMVDIPEIFVDYNLANMLVGKIYLSEVRFHLKELVVVKNKHGKLNIDSLKAVRSAKKAKERKAAGEPAKKEKRGMYIGKLSLKADKVIFKDYSQGGEPSIREFNINLSEELENITNANLLVSTILWKVLSRTTIATLANVDLSALESVVSQTLKSATGVAEKVLDNTTEGLKGATEGIINVLKLPFGVPKE